MKYPFDYGENIKRIRLKLNMTQEEFSERIGITQKSVSCIENGLRRPGHDVIENIALELGIPVSEIYYGVANVLVEQVDTA